jgi:C-terminal processing protease CtpA/Prc
MRLVRFPLVVVVATSLALGQTSNERLVAAVKLWAYVKYFHTNVTEDGVAWDAALESAAPQVLAAKTNDEFAAAIGEMLAVLKDPATHVATPADRSVVAAVVPIFEKYEDVTVVTFHPGDPGRAMQARQSMPAQLSGKGAVIFDLRGLRGNVLPATLPVSKVCQGPALARRTHLGYESETRGGTGGYRSTWTIEDGSRLVPGKGGIRPIFLVDGETGIPPLVLAFQNCGEGAIVSESPLKMSQVSPPPRPVLSGIEVFVRSFDFVYADGTTGLVANAVLNQHGTEALRFCKDMAISGKWPAPQGRPRYGRAPARFAEEAYSEDLYPTAPRRMLAAARIWAVFHYFHPYRHLYDKDWDEILAEFLPRMAQAEDAHTYHLAVAEMVTHTHDSHSDFVSRELKDFIGAPEPPVELRWIEDQPVVTRVFDTSAGVQPGDVLVQIDGKPFRHRVDDLVRHIAASTPQSLRGRVMSWLLDGAEGSTVRLVFRGTGGQEREVTLTRSWAYRRRKLPYRDGETVRLVRPRIGYVDLERLTNVEVDSMFQKLANTDAIIMDMRGYPQGTAWGIAPRLADAPGKLAAVFRVNWVSALGERGGILREARIPVTDKPRYTGKTVLLIDDRAISQSEHSGLMYKAANGTVFIGSPTAGAVGDTTEMVVPGGIRIGFSGADEHWPDGRQLQRIGLLPDIEVKQTIEGIRTGRDEVMDKAIEYLQRTLTHR